MNHENIWKAIDALAAQNHISCSKLAKQSGLDPTTFNKSKRITRAGKAHYPSMVSIVKILNTTGTTLCDFEKLMHQI